MSFMHYFISLSREPWGMIKCRWIRTLYEKLLKLISLSNVLKMTILFEIDLILNLISSARQVHYEDQRVQIIVNRRPHLTTADMVTSVCLLSVCLLLTYSFNINMSFMSSWPLIYDNVSDFDKQCQCQDHDDQVRSCHLWCQRLHRSVRYRVCPQGSQGTPGEW